VFVTYGTKLPKISSIRDGACRLLTTNTEQFFLCKRVYYDYEIRIILEFFRNLIIVYLKWLYT